MTSQLVTSKFCEPGAHNLCSSPHTTQVHGVFTASLSFLQVLLVTHISKNATGKTYLLKLGKTGV